MKTKTPNQLLSPREAFTLIEVFVVLVVIFVMVAMLIPVGGSRKYQYADRSACMNNQKQILLGLTMWNDDNNGRFPWQTSIANGGKRELISNGHATSQFQSISNYLKHASAVFTCPSDKTRHASTNFATMSDQNISYFANVNATTNTLTTSILTGDRNLLANGEAVKPGSFLLATNLDMGWTQDLHKTGGVLAFTDGHVQFVKTAEFNSVVKRQSLAANRLLVP